MARQYVYKFFWDVGRMGNVEGLFIAEADQVEKAIGSELYFGEILGKHSEIYGTLDKEDLTIINTTVEATDELFALCGDSICGYNPLDYIETDE